MPASRSARAMILAPRSCPSSPGFATTTLILRPSMGRRSLRCGAVRDRRMLLAGIVLLAVIVRLAGLGDRLSEDEGFSWLVASAPDPSAFLDRLAAYENTPPLFYLL